MNIRNTTKRITAGCLCLLTTVFSQAVAHDESDKSDAGVTMKISRPATERPITQVAVNIERRITERPVTRTLASVKGLGSREQLTTEQAIAAAITQSAVLFETRSDRLLNAEASHKSIVVRGNRLSMSYKRNLYERQCYLAAGPRLKWRTVNGYWAGRRVDSRAISYALTVLQRNGISLDKLKVTVNTKDDMIFAQRIVRSLRIDRKTIVELDPEAPVQAQATFNRN